MKYNLTSGHFLQDALGAPKMLTRGMINAKDMKLKMPMKFVRLSIEYVLSKEHPLHHPQLLQHLTQAHPKQYKQTLQNDHHSFWFVFSFQEGRHKMKYAYFPGCSASSTGISYTLSYDYVARCSGIEMEEIPDWNCCGASAAHNESHLLGDALPAVLLRFQKLPLVIPRC